MLSARCAHRAAWRAPPAPPGPRPAPGGRARSIASRPGSRSRSSREPGRRGPSDRLYRCGGRTTNLPRQRCSSVACRGQQQSFPRDGIKRGPIGAPGAGLRHPGQRDRAGRAGRRAQPPGRPPPRHPAAPGRAGSPRCGRASLRGLGDRAGLLKPPRLLHCVWEAKMMDPLPATSAQGLCRDLRALGGRWAASRTRACARHTRWRPPRPSPLAGRASDGLGTRRRPPRLDELVATRQSDPDSLQARAAGGRWLGCRGPRHHGLPHRAGPPGLHRRGPVSSPRRSRWGGDRWRGPQAATRWAPAWTASPAPREVVLPFTSSHRNSGSSPSIAVTATTAAATGPRAGTASTARLLRA